MSLTTNLKDAHIYIFKRWIVDFISRNQKFSSIRTDLLPVLAKMQWQSNLRKREGIDESTSLLVVSLMIVLSGVQVSNESSSHHEPDQMPINLKVGSPVSVSLYITSPSQYTVRANSIPAYVLLNHHHALLAPEPKKHPSSKAGSKTSVGQDSLVAENCVIGERVQIRKSVVAPNVNIGSRTTIRGCVIMQGVEIGENVKLEGCVICMEAKIGSKVSLTECNVGAGYKVDEGMKVAKQNLVELDELEDSEDDICQ